MLIHVCRHPYHSIIASIPSHSSLWANASLLREANVRHLCLPPKPHCASITSSEAHLTLMLPTPHLATASSHAGSLASTLPPRIVTTSSPHPSPGLSHVPTMAGPSFSPPDVKNLCLIIRRSPQRRQVLRAFHGTLYLLFTTYRYFCRLIVHLLL